MVIIKSPITASPFLEKTCYRESCIEEVLRYESPTQITARR